LTLRKTWGREHELALPHQKKKKVSIKKKKKKKKKKKRERTVSSVGTWQEGGPKQVKKKKHPKMERKTTLFLGSGWLVVLLICKGTMKNLPKPKIHWGGSKGEAVMLVRRK